MRQAYLSAIGRIEYKNVAAPIAREGETLVRVARVGICGSDLHVFHGEHPIVSPPLVQGHEFSGWAVTSGSQSRVRDGALITVNPAIGCGHCEN